MPAVQFARDTILNPRSPACLWKHPVQAGRLVAGALGNAAQPLVERILGQGSRDCPVCGWRGRRFRTFLSSDEIIPQCICPECGSFDRHRQLVLGVRDALQEKAPWSPAIMVGFSLSTAMRFLLEHEGLARCFRSDFAVGDLRFAPDFLTDLRQLALADNSVDWVFCSHVLEHVPDLDLCVEEILRILKPGGSAWIQVPFEPGLAHSRGIPIDPHRAHAHAWQFAPDFGLLLDRRGWEVSEIVAGQSLSASELHSYGIDPLERYWIATKS